MGRTARDSNDYKKRNGILLMKNQGNKSILTRNIFCILGLPFDAIDLSEASSLITSDIDKKQRCFLTTPNLNFLITAQSDSSFFQSVVDSDLIIADGMPIIWIAKLLGIPLTERVAGSDLFDELSSQNEQYKKTSVFFFGGQEGIAEQASHELNKSSQAMTCCGFYDPGFVSVDDMSTPTIIEYINKTNPDFLLVALGAGKGQAWIQKNRNHLNAPVISHLGAVVNFVAGNIIRAPVFWQQCGFEWLWRIIQEPGLWKRYFFDGLVLLKLLTFKVFPLAFYDQWLKKSDDFNTPATINHDDVAGSYTVNISGSVQYSNLNTIKQTFVDILQVERVDVTLNCSGISYIDTAFIGSLMLFQRQLNEQNRQLFLQNIPKRIFRLLVLNNVSSRFQF